MQRAVSESNAVKHLQKIKVRDEYRTPITIFANGCRQFKFEPLLDVSESSMTYPNWLDARIKLCRYVITDDTDMLRVDIKHDAFANLPYSKMQPMLEHLVACHRRNRISVLVLCFAKTDTHWWKDNVLDCSSCVFTKENCITGRIKFDCKHGFPSPYVAPYPSCFLFYDKNLLDQT